MPENKDSVESAAAEAAKKAETDAAAIAAGEGEGESPDPLKKELDKVRNASNKGPLKTTRKEKLLHKKQILEEELSEIEANEGDGSSSGDDEDDDTPVTVGMLEKREREKVQETAISLADDIEDETERELIKHHIENTIKPSGDAQKDFNNARAIVNSVKNSHIAEEAARKADPKRHGSGSGAPAKKGEGIFEPTPEESVFMKSPYNLSKEEIIEARKKQGNN